MNKFEQFASLHQAGDPLVLHNVWDVGSAGAVSQAGGSAIATSSWAVAMACGYEDGECLPLTTLLEIAEAIGRAVETPVSVDFEGGYAETMEGLQANARLLAETGAIGCNFEDRVVKGEGLFSTGEQSARIAAFREAVGESFFINARTDLFLSTDPAQHGERVEEAIERGHAYAAAGASGYFVPGLTECTMIRRIATSVPLPVNVMVTDINADLEPYRDAGVARISFGPALYIAAMGFVGAQAGRS